jgi:hypothetical protein
MAKPLRVSFLRYLFREIDDRFDYGEHVIRYHPSLVTHDSLLSETSVARFQSKILCLPELAVCIKLNSPLFGRL